MRILYVEDNKVNLMLVERIAQMGGHEVVNRTTGEAAIADFDDIDPVFVLMDIQLEGKMTGLDAVKELRAQGKKLPIIALTAYAMKGDRERALEAGCDEYLPKPLPVKVLLELLKKYDEQETVSAKAKTQESPAAKVVKQTQPSTATQQASKQPVQPVVAKAPEQQEPITQPEQLAAAKASEPQETTTQPEQPTAEKAPEPQEATTQPDEKLPAVKAEEQTTTAETKEPVVENKTETNDSVPDSPAATTDTKEAPSTETNTEVAKKDITAVETITDKKNIESENNKTPDYSEKKTG